MPLNSMEDVCINISDCLAQYDGSNGPEVLRSILDITIKPLNRVILGNQEFRQMLASKLQQYSTIDPDGTQEYRAKLAEQCSRINVRDFDKINDFVVP